MAIRYAESMTEIYRYIDEIRKDITERQKKQPSPRPLLWFRGHAVASYNLNPSIFRGADYKYNSYFTYSNNHLREDYRFQSFMARNFDNVDYKMPQYVIEWQEVMQHFFMKTRLMDWSESLIVALEFALDSFINPVKDKEVSERRKSAEPVIWVLEPNMLNEQVYKAFSEDSELICQAIPQRRNMLIKKRVHRFAQAIMEELQREEKNGTYYDIKMKNEQNLNRIIGLSALEVERSAYSGREMEAFENFEINPFFYLLLRYYSDGIPVELGKLPPLAVVHPYHSQRIKMQKGVFTVFPYYIPDEKMKQIKEKTKKYPPFGMEYMEQCIPYLHEIRIVNPERVADELMLTGAKRGNLYPDMQSISLDMENSI